MGSIVFVLAGIVALVIAAWQGFQTVRFVGRAERAVGHVVLAPGQTGAMASAHPTIEFAAADGRTIRYRQDGMGSRAAGTPVAILYDPADPATTAIARGFWTVWFPVLGPLVLGIAFLAVPLLGIEIRSGGARP